MERDTISVRVTEDQEEVAKKMARYDFLAMPVVDEENHLVGIVTHDDVIDVVVEEATEDAYRMGAVDPMEQNYLDAPLITVWRKRLVWLACLFIAELFTFTALSHFEDQIAKLVVLSLFVPLCISTGGNSGSQAATLITRAMALGQIRAGDWWRVLRHEIMLGLALGLTLGAIGILRGAATPESTRDASREVPESFQIRTPDNAPLTLDDRGRILVPKGSEQLVKATLTQHAHIALPLRAERNSHRQRTRSAVVRFSRQVHRQHRAGKPLAIGDGDWPGGGGDLLVGHAGRLDAAAGVPQNGHRSRLRFQPIRGHVCRRDRHRHLLQHRADLAGFVGSVD